MLPRREAEHAMTKKPFWNPRTRLLLTLGLVVLAGCVVDILANLFVLPLLGGAEFKRKSS